MSVIKNILQTFIFIIIIIFVGGLVLPSTQKITRILPIKSTRGKIISLVKKTYQGKDSTNAEGDFYYSFTNAKGKNEIKLKATNKVPELKWIVFVNAGNNILKRYKNLVVVKTEGAELEKVMLDLKNKCESK